MNLSVSVGGRWERAGHKHSDNSDNHSGLVRGSNEMAWGELYKL